MPAYYAPRYEQFLQQAIGTFAVRAGLTDVSDSSVTKYIFAGFCRILSELSYSTTNQQLSWNIDTAAGLDLDQRAAELSAGNLKRLSANPAIGNVVFYTNSPGGTVSIPIGTQVNAADGTQFATTVASTISPANVAQIAGHVVGQDSGLVPIVASVSGSSSNQAARAISSLGQRPSGVDGVLNLTPTNYGQDAETDDGLRARIRNYAATLARSTVSAIEGAVLGAQDPTTGATIEHANLVESESTPGSSTIYIDDGSGQAASTKSATAENLTKNLDGPGGNSAAGGETSLPLANTPVDMQAAPVLQSSVRGPLLYGTTFGVDPLSGQISFTPALVSGEVITASYTYYTGLVALAQKIVDGDPADRAHFPGYRAAGTRVSVATPQVISVPVTAIVSVNSAYDATTVIAACQSGIVSYINGLSIGDPVQLASIISATMGIAGVFNVVLVTPSSDVIVTQTQLVRTDPSRVLVS
jgi:uncharacterized phage protein gp47/JayE